MDIARKSLDLSIIIITKNEASRLPRCLSSLPAGCEIVIVDCGSDDQTVTIAQSFGAQVHHHAFQDYASQKNFALSKASRSWVLSLDADEELSSILRDDIQRFLNSAPNTTNIYQMSRRLVFMGRVMNYGRTADKPTRLFRNGAASFQGAIHERLVTKTNSDSVQSFPSQGFILHYSYENLSDYFQKFNRYTTLMAEDKWERSINVQSTLHLCLRPWVNFIYRYFVRLGFLDGYPGYAWALLGSFYSFVKYAKLKEQGTLIKD